VRTGFAACPFLRSCTAGLIDPAVSFGTTCPGGVVNVFAPEVLDHLAALGRPVIDLSTEVIPALVPRIQARVHNGFFRDIGSPEALAEAEAQFPDRP
jgi:NDP-sugar pyrophosphorylase family protein